MIPFLKILLIAFMIGTVVFMIRGIRTMGQEGHQERSNQLMTQRLWTQAVAFILLAMLLWTKG